MNLMLILIPTAMILLSQFYINHTYKKYSMVDIKSKYSGKDVTQKILEKNNIKNVKIKKISGALTDHFNPKTGEINLSEDIYNDSSVASVAVAAHECGHVIQHKEKYFFIILRSMLVPIVNISSKLGYIILIIGFLSSVLDLALIGLILMCFALLFQLVTLPTEFNASKRAIDELLSLNIITNQEKPMVKKMLLSAALTYVASFFANILEMLRLFLAIRNND